MVKIMIKQYFLTPVLLLSVLLILMGCVTRSSSEERLAKDFLAQDLSVGIYFKQAQDEYSIGNYERAEMFYRLGMLRFPDDNVSIVTALYEIGFIYYKQEEYATAKSYFYATLGMYETNSFLKQMAPGLDRLSELMLQKIDDKEQ